MTEKELRDSVKHPGGGYFFWGDEDYLKAHYVKEIRRAVLTDESVAPFNDIPFDGDSFTPEALADAIAAPPVMADKKLIRAVLDDYGALPDKTKRELLDVYGTLGDFSDTVLVISVRAGGFDGGTEKRPSSALKSISACMNTVAFPFQPEGKLLRWLSRHFSEYGLKADDDALRLMLRIGGRSMYRLAGEADKAASYVLSHFPDGKTVTAGIISDVVSATPEEDAYRLANAVLSGDRAGALESLGRAKKRGENPIRLMAAVSAVICDMAAVSRLAAAGADKREISGKLKMHEYKAMLYMRGTAGISSDDIRRAVAMCVETDLKMKSTSLGFIPLERLICSACGSRRDANGG